MNSPGELISIEGAQPSPEAALITQSIVARSPYTAVVVMEIRIDEATQRPVLRGKCCNRNFLFLSDAITLKSGDPYDVFVLSPVFTNQDSQKIFYTVLKRCYDIAIAFMTQKASHVPLYNVFITKVGRLRKVYKEMIAVRPTGRSCEFVITECLLPDSFELTADLIPHTSYALPAPPLKVHQEVMPVPALRHAAPAAYGPAPPDAEDDDDESWTPADEPSVEESSKWRWTVVGEKAVQRLREKRKQRHYIVMCAQCGRTETPQRRCVAATMPPESHTHTAQARATRRGDAVQPLRAAVAARGGDGLGSLELIIT